MELFGQVDRHTQAGFPAEERARAKQWGSVRHVEAEVCRVCSVRAREVPTQRGRGEHPCTGNTDHEGPCAPIRSLNFILRAVEAGEVWGESLNILNQQGWKRWRRSERYFGGRKGRRGNSMTWVSGETFPSPGESARTVVIYRQPLGPHRAAAGASCCLCPKGLQEGFRKTEGNTEWRGGKQK